MARRRKSDTRGWKIIRDKLKKADGARVKVGVLASAGGNTRTADGKLNMVGLAAIHEYGAPKAGIPERSFIRSTFAARKDDVKRLSTRLGIGYIKGKISLARALETLGQAGVAMVRDTITRGDGPPPKLKPATIKAKGSDHRLIDTGRLLGSISYEVTNAGARGRGGFRK